MCLRTRVQVSKKKVEKSRLILHPYATNKPAQASPPVSDSLPARSPPARTPLTTTTPLRLSATQSPSPNQSPNHVRTLATTTPGAALPTIETLTNDVALKWARPLHTLPIAGDFPRLAKVTTIYVGADHKDISRLPVDRGDHEVEHGQHPPSNRQSLEHIIYDTLLKLAIYLHDPTTLQSTREHFWDYHKGDVEGEVARSFGLFLKSCMHDGDNVGVVLKSINQAILAPAVIALKMAISSLPFKDYGNSWRVKVFISDDDSVEIVHVRREQSFGPQQQGEAMKFEFVWELSIRIDLKNRYDRNNNSTNPTTNPSAPAPSPTSTAKNDNNSNKSDEYQLPGRSDALHPRIDVPPHTTTIATPLPSASSSALPTPSDKYITSVTLQIVEIAFGPNVPPENKEKVLGDMRRLTSSTCVVTTIA